MPAASAKPDETEQQQDLSKMLDDKLEAYFAEREKKSVTPKTTKTNNRRNDVTCYHCGKKGHMKRDCWKWKNENVGCVLGSNSAVMIRGKINGRREAMLVDSGAGPCIIDLATLKSINADITLEAVNTKLEGIGTAEVLGTARLDIELHPEIKVKQQVFKVVDKLGVVLLGRNLLKKLSSLEISWKSMELRIDGHVIPSSKVINGGVLDARLYVAQDKTISDKQMTDEISREVELSDALNANDKQKLRELLHEFHDIFIDNPKKPPETKLVSHVIDTQNVQPTRDKLRRLPPRWADEIERQINEMLENGICRPSNNSPWSKCYYQRRRMGQCDLS